jgi:PAS domain-containing protein
MPLPNRSASAAPSMPFSADAALNALDDGYCVVTPDWRVAFVNRAFERIQGTAGRLGVGHDFWRAFPALRGTPHAEVARATMQDGETRSFRIVCHGSHGAAEFDVKVTGMPEGGICVQCLDVSEATRFERELAEWSEENASLREVARALA